MMHLKKRLNSIVPLAEREAKFRKAVDEITRLLKKNKYVTTIVLFGSYARGDYSVMHSDIDFFVFIDKESKDEALEKNLNMSAINTGTKYKVTIHLTYQYSKITDEDSSLIKKIAADGKVLYNRNSLIISKDILGLRVFELIRFDTANVKQLNKTKFSRLLHGYKSWHYKGGKKIMAEYKGIIDNNEIFEAGKGALLVAQSNAEKLVLLAEELGIKVISLGNFYR